MTIEKIKELNLPDSTYADGTRQIEMKINEIIGWINEHDNSGRHIVPSSSLTGGEKGKCSDPRGNQLCTDGINTYHQFNTTEPGYKCSYCNQKAPKKPETKSNTLREKIFEIINDYPSKDTEHGWNLIKSNQVISLVKVHLEKEIKKAEPLYIEGESEDFTKGQEWQMAQVKQIIKNL